MTSFHMTINWVIFERKEVHSLRFRLGGICLVTLSLVTVQMSFCATPQKTDVPSHSYDKDEDRRFPWHPDPETPAPKVPQVL